MHLHCGINGGAKAEVGTAAATANQLAFTIDVNPGDDVQCVLQAKQGQDQSEASTQAVAHVPLVMPVPVLRLRVAP